MKTNNILNLPDYNTIPKSVQWNSHKGWNDYQKFSARQRTLKVRFMISSAAAILIVLILSTFLYPRIVTRNYVFTNTENAAQHFQLPDGTNFWLKTNSQLKCKVNTHSELAQAEINGEAFFEPNHKSMIWEFKAANAVVKTMGESAFNIRSESKEEHITITVESGLIQVFEESSPSGMSLLVSEGQFGSVHKSSKLVYTAMNKNSNYNAWKTGLFTFTNQPIANVADVLSAYFNKQFELTDKQLAYCLFSGEFPTSAFNDILKKIENDLQIQIETSENTITFKGKGCNKS